MMIMACPRKTFEAESFNLIVEKTNLDDPGNEMNAKDRTLFCRSNYNIRSTHCGGESAPWCKA